MMKVASILVLVLSFLTSKASASVFLPYGLQVKESSIRSISPSSRTMSRDARWALRNRQRSDPNAAMAIPGYGITEQIFVGGFANFLSIYNLIITARILLSWFPQAQGIAILQPVYAVTDPYLNLFRGIIPPLFGLDFSPILAFLLLNVLGSATAAVGAEIPPQLRLKQQSTSAFRKQNVLKRFTSRSDDNTRLSLNL